MASTNRLVYTDAHFRLLPVASATVIEAGDLLYWDRANNEVINAAAYTWNATEAETAREFAGVFAGIAMDASASGDTDDIRVAIRGVARQPCASATVVADQPVGPEKATGNTLEDQKVQTVTDAASAIGIAVSSGTTQTFITFAFESKLFAASHVQGSLLALVDPGDAGAISPVVDTYMALVSTNASGETRTLSDPVYPGQKLTLVHKTDGGDIVITADTQVNQATNTSLTFADAGDHLKLEGVEEGTSLEWRIVANDGIALA